eukprot:TRINITY_DN8767_c0_g1_i1.p1 TRINITY_DN8767_c0_g1~~TRINITY_DN8767_c0_g1_i1.p1  ORF type:complete len:3649 (-),score=794.98 TRINITY_DN8767_c0_g1_i1:25-9951(-)
MEVLTKRANDLKSELEEWNEMVKEMRTNYYFLNFFSIAQIVQILEYLEEGPKALPALQSILRFVSTKIQLNQVWVKNNGETPRVRLQALGKYLDATFGNLPPVVRQTKNIVTSGSTYLFDEGSQGLYVIPCAADKVLDLTFTLYVQQGRVPEPDEVIFCNKNTKMEDIALLLYRWAFAKKHKRKDRLFTLVNIEALWYTTQAKIVEMIHSFNLDNCSYFAFITCQPEGQHLVSAFQNRRIQVVPLEAEVLRSLYQNMLTNGGTVKTRAMVFSSPIPGAGKSHSIRAYVSISFDNQNYRHVPVVGTTTNGELITLLQRNPETCVLDEGGKSFHIDIGPTHTSDLNDQLFQLLVMGILQDESGRFYHRREQDIFLIEVPNVYVKVQKEPKDTFLHLLPSTVVDVTPETFDQTTYKYATTETGDQTWNGLNNYEAQFVCKYLHAFQSEKFLRFAATDEDFHPDIIPDLDGPTCFKLLTNYVKSDGPVSFILFSNFVKFAYQQLVNITYYDLLSNAAVAGALECPPFKNFIVDFLIRTAVDFSTRAVEYDGPKNDLIGDGDGNALNEALASRFDRMRHWEDSEHPFVVLNQADVKLSNILPGGIGIISLSPTLIDSCMDKNMKTLLTLNGYNFDVNYSKISKEDAQNLLRVILGVFNEDDPDLNYVLTFDNLMKMISIQLRVKCNIPVVIMGETGCGKTSLVKYLCEFINVPLHKLDVHGGITDEYILDWMQKPISDARKNRGQDIYVFFDEINTCNSMSLFKSIVCDNYLNGNLLPDNLKFIAACNPYRLLSDKDVERERIGLVFEHKHALDVIPDPLANLVYRVHPLPETLIEYVWDFGSLPLEIEKLYIHSILTQKYINDLEHGDKFVEQFLDFLSTIISSSHAWMRERMYTCSLRDVSRFIKLLNWFKESLLKRVRMKESNSSKETILKQAAVLTLTHCYLSRLNELRGEYRKYMETTWNGKQFGPLRMVPGEFHRIAVEEQKYYAKQMIASGSGIALNEALCENIFMILVCILNMIPIFVVGKPGSSKSLSIELIGSHLNGKMSDVPFFQEYPAVEVFSYQCSPLSTSQGIEQTFRHAKKYQSNASNTIVVVLLDEVGLAEQSSHLPLKVLHKLLEHPEVAVVGISNWTLDRAKMNRAIHLTRPEPGVEDLKDTAMGIITNQHLSASLRSLAEAYYQVYHKQRKVDFFGLRDYYHLIKFLHRNLEDTVTPELLESAVRRNFGGIPSELVKIMDEFFSRVGLARSKANEKNSKSVIKLIESNLSDKYARHLMLLTHNDAALQLLFDQELLQHEKTVVLFGSDFPADQSDLYICLNIQTIKSCMAKGETVILIHSENLYESLYDMLNQHYTEYQGQRYVRLAIGTTSKLCPIHNDFRVIVIVDINEAYSRLAPPLLNRFEKQVFLRQNLLQESHQLKCSQLSKFILNFVESINKQGSKTTDNQYTADEIFAGYHSDTTSSLVLSLAGKAVEGKDDDTLNEAIIRLLWLARPECVLLASKSNTLGYDWEKIYFYEQHHENLPDFLDYTFCENLKNNKWGDGLGVMSIIMTYSPLSDYTNELFQYYPVHKELTYEEQLKAEQEELTSKIEELQRQMERARGEGQTDNEQNLKLLTDTQTKLQACIKKQIEAQEKGEGLEKSSEITKEKVEEYKIPVCLKLHDFSSESELLHSVSSFFLLNSDSTILIQCDPAAVTYQRIVHARYLCEKERSEYQKTKKSYKKHIFFLIHLNRTSETKYTFDYDSRWNYALVDDIKPAKLSHIPATIDLLHGSELDLLKTELSNTLHRTFRTCLARLIYPFERNSSLIQDQIEMMLELFDDDDFMGVFKDRMISLIEMDIKHKTNSMNTNWQVNVASSKHGIVSSGTFRMALFNRLSDTVTRVFMHILCCLDRNGNLTLYFQNRSNRALKELWLRIFQDPTIFALSIVDNSELEFEPRYDVHSDGLKGPFQASFPFSFTFCNSIESMRSEAAKITTNIGDALDRLIHSVFGSFFETSVQQSHIELYLKDYIRMHGHMTQVEDEVQFLISREIILKEISGHLTVGKIHNQNWSNESRLQHVYRLLDLFPKVVHELMVYTQKLKNKDFDLNDFDLAVSALVLSQLEPSGDDWSTLPRQRDWVAKISAAQPSLQMLLYGKSGQLGDKWEKILFLRSFIRDVSLQVLVPPTTSIKFSQIIFSGTFQSKATFEGMVQVLCSIAKGSDQHMKQCSLMVELYLTEFLLSDKAHLDKIDPALLKKLFVDMLVDSQNSLSGLTVTMPMKTFLFNFLNTTKDKRILEFIAALEKHLSQNLEGSNNVLLVQCAEYLQAQRDFLLNQEQKNSLIVTAIKQIATIPFDGKNLWQKLIDIGQIRYFLTQFADECIKIHSEAVAAVPGYIEQANRLLSKKKDQNEEKYVDSMRLFLLKQITRQKGTTFSQELLNNTTIQKLLPWINDWSNYSKIQQFLRKKHLIEHDPFYLDDGYASLNQLLRSYMDGNYTPLQDYLNLNNTNIHPKTKSLLLLAIFNEVTLTHTTHHQQSHALPLKQLFTLITNSKFYNQTELTIINHYIFNTFPSKHFTLSPTSSQSQVLLLSCITHLISLTFSPLNHTLLTTLLFNPLSLGKTYIPTMPNDERLALMQVLGGGWYECPKGHTYYVSECGRPTQEYVCPTCKTKIGGLEHVLEQTNKVASKSDMTLPGYLLTSVENYPDTYASERNLPPMAFRLIRFFIHGLLSISGLLSTELEGQVKILTGSQQEDVNEFVMSHLLNDWVILKNLVGRNEEEVTVFVHLVCSSLLSNATAPLVSTLTKEERTAMEDSFFQTHLSAIIKDVESAISAFYKNYDVENSLLSDIRERTNLTKLSKNERNLTLPTLWRFRQPMTMDHLTMHFNLQASNKLDYPILHMFLTDEEKVRTLCHLYHAIEWPALLAKKFDKRIDRRFSSSTTIGEVLRDLPIDEARRWETAFNGFKSAWNTLWVHVDRFTCMEIPQDWKTIVMDEKVTICFCLMDEKDEGICSLALLNYMVNKHNQFFEKLSAIKKEKGENDDFKFKVSSRTLKPSHLIKYNIETELLPFLQRQAEQDLEYGKGANIHYNFKRIEQYVIDTILAGKPQIDLEVRRFTYTNEARVLGSLALVKDVITQAPLTEDMKTKLKQELGSNLHLTNKVLRLLEICIGFITATGSHNHQIPGDQFLASYIKDTLLMKEDLGSYLEKTVQLRHIVAFYQLLEKQLNIDPFENVMPQYTKQLPQNLQQVVKEAAPKLNLRVLLPLMKECLLRYMTEGGNIGPEVSVWDVLGVWEIPGVGELGEEEWFKSHFPRTIESRFFLSTYKFLNSCT